MQMNIQGCYALQQTKITQCIYQPESRTFLSQDLSGK